MGDDVENEFVAGFAFYENHVALLRKAKPEWQKGMLNGIGGKREEGENFIDAMVREFEEETGYKTNHDDWRLFHNMKGDGYEVNFFTSYFPGSGHAFRSLRNTEDTDETVYFLDLSHPSWSNRDDIIYNLKWLIPLALDRSVNQSCSWGF